MLIAQQGEFFVGIAFGGFLNGGEPVFDKAGAGVALIDERSSGKGRESDEEEDEKSDQRWHKAVGIRKAPQGDKEASQTRDYCVAKNATHRAARPDPSPRKERLLRMTTNRK